MSGSLLEMQFTKAMKDPSGKQAQFSPKKVVNVPPSLYQEWVGCIPSPVLSADFPYQILMYAGDTKLLFASAYKIFADVPNTALYPWDTVSNTLKTMKFYSLPFGNTTWNFIGDRDFNGYNGYTFEQANYDVLANNDKTTLVWAKTTTGGGGGTTEINLTPVSISVDPIVPEILALYLSETITYGDVIKVSYTKGTIESVEGKLLESFTDANVTNLVPSPIPDYQDWANYPDSPLLTTSYPSQLICQRYNGDIYLLMDNASPYYLESNDETIATVNDGVHVKWYKLTGGVWELIVGNYYSFYLGWNIKTNNAIKECNGNVYNNSTLTTIYKNKTTT